MSTVLEKIKSRMIRRKTVEGYTPVTYGGVYYPVERKDDMGE